MARTIKLERHTWTLGRRIGDPSGFGKVYGATADDGTDGVVKLVAKEPGAARELLFEELTDVPNVIPIIDRGETRDSWAIAMPRADRSLRGFLDSAGGRLSVEEALLVLIDIATALVAIDGRVVHRDIRSENVLFWQGHWCLADFGIARYAEASTAPDTRKMALWPPFAAPERWRYEHATSAADVYSFGVLAFESLMGQLPFPGPTWEDFREQHLHRPAPDVTGVPPQLASLVAQCLIKSSEARPTPLMLLEQLERSGRPVSPAAARLAAAHLSVAADQAREHAERSAAATDRERRDELFAAAEQGMKAISVRLRDAVLAAAPLAERDPRSSADDWALRLGSASIGMDVTGKVSLGNFDRWPPPFDLIAAAAVGIHIPPGSREYEGRSHSLWFGDIQEKGVYRWFETGFMISIFRQLRMRQVPAALAADEKAGKALIGSEFALARPFQPIDQGEEDAFTERWLDWFAAAVSGQLMQPSSLPEIRPEGSWRKG